MRPASRKTVCSLIMAHIVAYTGDIKGVLCPRWYDVRLSGVDT
jgi:hypothetical protein